MGDSTAKDRRRRPRNDPATREGRRRARIQEGLDRRADELARKFRDQREGS